MALNTIWVYAEADDGKVSPLTLELLTKARSLGGTVEAVYAGDDADAVAGPLGAHGATKVHSTGDLGGSLAGVPVASAIAKAIERRQRPRPAPARHHLRGPRHRRPPVGGRRQAGAHQQRRPRGRRRRGRRHRADLRWHQAREDEVHRRRPVHRPHPAEVVRRPRSPAAAPPRSRALEVTDAGTAKVINRHVEEATGPKLDEANIVVSGGRGLGEAGKYEMIESSPSCSRRRPVRPAPSSTPAGCPTATRSARPARS